VNIMEFEARKIQELCKMIKDLEEMKKKGQFAHWQRNAFDVVTMIMVKEIEEVATRIINGTDPNSIPF